VFALPSSRVFKGINVCGQPIIPVLFEVPAYGVSKIVRFLVDTGSKVSLITEMEATLAGIDCGTLPFAKDISIGFGGLFKHKTLNYLVTLTFSSNNDELKINHNSGFSVICPPENLEPKNREIMLRHTPCVLGMDILSKFEVYLSKRRVELIYLGD
jgi:hypothetical protein